jgi:hypothetical protein
MLVLTGCTDTVDTFPMNAAAQRLGLPSWRHYTICPKSHAKPKSGRNQTVPNPIVGRLRPCRTAITGISRSKSSFDHAIMSSEDWPTPLTCNFEQIVW